MISGDQSLLADQEVGTRNILAGLDSSFDGTLIHDNLLPHYLEVCRYRGGFVNHDARRTGS